MRNNKKKNEEPDDRFVSVQQVQKNGKGQEIIVNKTIPRHLAEDPKKAKMLKRLGIILESDVAFVSKEQVEQEKQDYREWAASIDNVTVLQTLLPTEKIKFKVDILEERIKELKASKPKKEPKEKEPVTLETPQQ